MFDDTELYVSVSPRASQAIQSRVEALLEKNAEDLLSPEESAELARHRGDR